VTDVNFPGLEIDSAARRRLLVEVDALTEEASWFVLSGSVPAGVPDDVYDGLVRRLRERGKSVALDTSGAPFAAALGAGPSLVKPNLDELREITGRRLADHRAVAASARELVEGGIELVAVSMGAEGAVFVERGEALVAVPPPAVVNTTVGAGDAMVAGLVTGALRGLGLAARARLATAFAVAALGEIGPRLPPPDEVERIAERVTIRAVEPA
jgi:1-phosphofructokinase family hexose kinase